MITYKICFAHSFDSATFMLDGKFENEYKDHPVVDINKYDVYLLDESRNTLCQLKTVRFVHLQQNKTNVKSELPNYSYNVHKDEIKEDYVLTNCMLHFEEKA